MALNSFVLLLKSFIANVRKYEACLKEKFKYVCVTVCSIVKSLFLCDYIQMETD